uniref:Uncharacterized protein n=1 Tax=Arundo donax TaxID=35708 RepID=A0A0A8YFB0_ARUDO
MAHTMEMAAKMRAYPFSVTQIAHSHFPTTNTPLYSHQSLDTTYFFISVWFLELKSVWKGL